MCDPKTLQLSLLFPLFLIVFPKLCFVPFSLFLPLPCGIPDDDGRLGNRKQSIAQGPLRLPLPALVDTKLMIAPRNLFQSKMLGYCKSNWEEIWGVYLQMSGSSRNNEDFIATLSRHFVIRFSQTLKSSFQQIEGDLEEHAWLYRQNWSHSLEQSRAIGMPFVVSQRTWLSGNEYSDRPIWTEEKRLAIFGLIYEIRLPLTYQGQRKKKDLKFIIAH